MINSLIKIWDRMIVAVIAIQLLGAFLAPLFPQVLDPAFWKGICHQIPSRSFAYTDVHMPICGRCTGIFMGFLIGRFWFGIDSLSKKKMGYSLLLILLMILEWRLSHQGLISSTNGIRWMAGVSFGLGYSYFFHSIPLALLRKLSGKKWRARQTWLMSWPSKS